MSKNIMVVFPFIKGIFLGKLDAFWGQRGKTYLQGFESDTGVKWQPQTLWHEEYQYKPTIQSNQFLKPTKLIFKPSK